MRFFAFAMPLGLLAARLRHPMPLFATLLLVAVACSAPAHPPRGQRLGAATVASIDPQGGKGAQNSMTSEPPALSWYWKWLGPRLGLLWLPVSREQAVRVERDTDYSARLDGRLVWLDLSEPRGLAHINEVSGPIALTLGKGEVLSTLQALKDVSEEHALGLALADATDAGLRQLKVLPHLQALSLAGTEVTDAGLAHLKGLTSLRALNLRRTKVTDAGMANLRSIKQLQTLDLFQTKITDAGLAHLEKLTGLRELYLWETKITDAGLAHLESMTGLRTLGVGGSEVTDAALARLKALLPHL